MVYSSKFIGIDSALIIDYRNKKIIEEKSAWDSDNICFLFSDITGIELRSPTFLSYGSVRFIVNGKRLTIKKASNLNDALYKQAYAFYIKDLTQFSRLAKELRSFADTKNIPIGDVGSIKAKFALLSDYTAEIETTKVETTEVETTEVEANEKRVYCNVCGQIFCYTKQDMLKNEALKKKVVSYNKSGLVQALFSNSITANQTYSQANQLEAQIKDFSRCPHCGSSDLKEISEEELKNMHSQPNNSNSGTVSATDEIKKFKDLLDMGAITQEEFDAKKKQLLGL